MEAGRTAREPLAHGGEVTEAAREGAPSVEGAVHLAGSELLLASQRGELSESAGEGVAVEPASTAAAERRRAALHGREGPEPAWHAQ